MKFALSLLDISIWLAVVTVILLATSELLYVLPEYSNEILVDKKRMSLAGAAAGLAFLVTAILQLI